MMNNIPMTLTKMDKICENDEQVRIEYNTYDHIYGYETLKIHK